MSGTLKGKKALVTGGSRGIGAAIAARLADEGADVALSYVSSQPKAEAVAESLAAKGVKAYAIKADQSDPAKVSALVKEAAQKLGGLDILVNNAGVLSGVALDTPADEAALAHQIAVNITAIGVAVRTAAPLLSDGGRIITMGSVVAERVPFPGAADYAMSKTALLGYTRGWSRDLGKRGITVNAVQPGPVDTDMNPDTDSDTANFLKSLTSLGRFAKPGEIAAAVAFLAGPEAGFITGTTLTIDGGMSA